jgi:hypothetical protein
MSRLSALFRHADVEFGVFYPNHCLLVVFENLTDADVAKEDLNHAGLKDEDVISVAFIKPISCRPRLACLE